MKEKLLEEARKKMKNPDYIINIFDLSPEWASEKMLKVLEYEKASDVTQVTDVIALESEEERRELATEVLEVEGTKVSKFKLRSRKGKIIIIEAEITRLDFERTPYEVGRLLSYSEEKK